MPLAIGQLFEAHGHEVVYFADVLKSGSPDVIVAKAAIANEAILVAFDRDMRQFVKRTGNDQDRFKRLDLIQFACTAPVAIARLQHAMSLIEHEWTISQRKVARQLHISIANHVLKTHR